MRLKLGVKLANLQPQMVLAAVIIEGSWRRVRNHFRVGLEALGDVLALRGSGFGLSDAESN